MSNDCLQKPYKQRFKGVENFLRRVAFNLGNTPSQTDVKIISCIPIDVTDLQQKILNLEKQLYNYQKEIISKDTTVTAECPGPDLCGADFNQPTTVAYCSQQLDNVNSCCEEIAKSMKKSNVSFIFPAVSPPDEQTSKFGSCECSNTTDLNGIDRCKNIFRKRKKKKAKSKPNTHLVYYAQTPRSPFSYHLSTRKTPSSTEVMCRSHLNKVMKRQYDPNVVIEEFSDTSNFTKPICRDSVAKCTDSHQYESKTYSCCHGAFHDIDKFRTAPKYDDMIPKVYNLIDTTDIYNNSKDYDVIPVKDNSNKFQKENKHTKTQHVQKMELKFHPKNYRVSRPSPFKHNYQLGTHIDESRVNQKLLEIKNKPKQVDKKSYIKKKYLADKTPMNSAIECGQVYTKRFLQKATVQRSEPVKVIIQKNEMVSTENVEGLSRNLQVNTRSTQIELNMCDDDKTESTLNQIKTMLENVLAEVKTSARLNNNPEEKPKVDAVVQKGISHNNVQGVSTLLHTFSYNNSYNAYVPSCSQHIPQQYCLTNISSPPIKLQNYPVFVQPAPRKHQCACACYYKNNHSKLNTAATNTEKEIDNSNKMETEKLIKEIYKSMAINFDITTKENSLSESEDIKSVDGSTNTTEVKNAAIVTSKRDIEVEALMTSFESNTSDSKTTYVASKHSDEKDSMDELIYRNALNNMKIGQNNNIQKLKPFNEVIIEDDETDYSEENSDSNDTVVEGYFDAKKSEKKSVFQRMFKSVKLFHKKKDIQEKSEHKQENLASDSDDYETVYSENTTHSPKPFIEKKHRHYSKIRRTPASKHATRVRAPYLEQEYRQQWNEKFMFQDQQRKNSSEKPLTSPYWSNYEVRSAFVEQKPKTTNHQLVSAQTTQNNVKTKKAVGWLKKHKLGVNCGEQWKNFLLEN